MKYIPTTLIVGLNITIAWKMKSIANLRVNFQSKISGNPKPIRLQPFDFQLHCEKSRIGLVNVSKKVRSMELCK